MAAKRTVKTASKPRPRTETIESYHAIEYRDSPDAPWQLWLKGGEKATRGRIAEARRDEVAFRPDREFRLAHIKVVRAVVPE